jgi:hypothetical protein
MSFRVSSLPPLGREEQWLKGTLALEAEGEK